MSRLSTTVIRPVFLMVLAAFTSCGSGEWGADAQDKFLDECAEEGGAGSYCRCYLDKVMEQYPNPDDAEDMDFETAVELADQCD